MRRRDFLKAALVVPFIPKKEQLTVDKIELSCSPGHPGGSYPSTTITWSDGQIMKWDRVLSSKEVQSLYSDQYQMFKVII